MCELPDRSPHTVIKFKSTDEGPEDTLGVITFKSR